MLFDTHAHMNDPAFDEDRNEMILGLKEKGTDFVMNVGCCLESSKDCIALAEAYPFVYASVGSHPDSADEVNEEVIEKYRIMAYKCGSFGRKITYFPVFSRTNVCRAFLTRQRRLVGFLVAIFTPLRGFDAD